MSLETLGFRQINKPESPQNTQEKIQDRSEDINPPNIAESRFAHSVIIFGLAYDNRTYNNLTSNDLTTHAKKAKNPQARYLKEALGDQSPTTPKDALLTFALNNLPGQETPGYSKDLRNRISNLEKAILEEKSNT